jgi:hypothetical protein
VVGLAPAAVLFAVRLGKIVFFPQLQAQAAAAARLFLRKPQVVLVALAVVAQEVEEVELEPRIKVMPAVGV